MTSKNDSRFISGSSIVYERPDRRRTPSPAYDRYVPPRPSPPFRENHMNSYRPNDAWRAPYSDQPSPDRFRPPARYPEPERHGGPSWRAAGPSTWNDRRGVPEPLDSGWERTPRDTMAQPMFEPSDHWKQSHGVAGDPSDIVPRHRNDWYNDRYVEEFPRDPGERSPERLPIREPYEDAHSERYRRFIAPQDQREPHTYGPRSDSYRPPFPQQSPWAYHPTSPYPPPEFSPRDTRPRRRGAWPAIRPEFGDRVRFSRERSVSGGSVRNSPIPSPIRTRTNLPDRITYRGPRSASISGSYPSSPTKHQARHSWGYDAPPHSRYSRSRSRSNSFESPEPDPHAIQTSNLDRGRPRDRSADNQEDFRSRSNSFDSREQDRSYNRASRISGPERGYPDDRSVENQEDASVRPYYHRSSSIASSRSSGRNREPTGGLQTQTANRTPSPAREHETAPDRASEPKISNVTLRKEPLVIDTSVAHAQPFLTRTNSTVADGDAATIAPRSSVPEHLAERTASPYELSPPGLRAHLPAPIQTNEVRRTPTSVPQTPAQEYSEPPSREDRGSKLKSSIAAPEQVGEPMPLRDALCAIVALRLQRDHQTVEERVNPVLLDNLSKVDPISVSVTSPEAVITAVTSGSHRRALDNGFDSVKPSLEVRFAQRKADLTEKVARLRDDYLTLHRQWLIHCSKLDDVAKNAALQEAAATAGRTTRRSLATMGDAVRSDLEMEQIIASLGNEELTDATHLGARNAAVIPDMLTVTKGEIDYLFDDTNKEIDDPSTYYAPKIGFDDWTDEEITTFIEKYGEHPKQFGIIADSLPEKTAAQCVSFYYLHKHKHFDFRQVIARRATKRKRGGRKQKGNALLADIIRRDEEVSVNTPARRRRAEASNNTETRRQPARRGAAFVQAEQTPNGTPTPEPDGEPRKRRRRVTARAAVMDLDEMEEEFEPKKRGRKPRKSGNASVTPASTPTISLTDAPMEEPVFSTKFPDQVVATMQRRTATSSHSWSEDDKRVFLQLLGQYGDDFKRISASMPNKTAAQVSAFYRSNAIALDLASVVASAPRRSPSPSNHDDVWQQATFAGPGVVFQDMQTPTEAMQSKFSARAEGDMRNFPASGDALGSTLIPSSQSGIVRFRSTTYESMQAQYQAAEQARAPNSFITRAYPANDEPMASLTPVPGEQIMNPSPFAPGAPLMTRFPNYAYNNFTPSHFIDANGARQGSPYTPSVRVRAVEPVDVTGTSAR